jgi:Bacteriocin class II with double-glycine leader peptide
MTTINMEAVQELNDHELESVAGGWPSVAGVIESTKNGAIAGNLAGRALTGTTAGAVVGEVIGAVAGFVSGMLD